MRHRRLYRRAFGWEVLGATAEALGAALGFVACVLGWVLFTLTVFLGVAFLAVWWLARDVRP